MGIQLQVYVLYWETNTIDDKYIWMEYLTNNKVHRAYNITHINIYWHGDHKAIIITKIELIPGQI